MRKLTVLPITLITIALLALFGPAQTTTTYAELDQLTGLNLVDHFGGVNNAVVVDPIKMVAYVGSGEHVYIVDVSNPENPSYIDEVQLEGGEIWSLELTEDGNVLYVATLGDKLFAVNLAIDGPALSWTEVLEVGTKATTSVNTDTMNNSELNALVETTDGTLSRNASGFAILETMVFEMEVVDNQLWTVHWETGPGGDGALEVFDISSPFAPKTIARFQPEDDDLHIVDMALDLQSNRVFIVYLFGGMRTMDVSDLDNIHEVNEKTDRMIRIVSRDTKSGLLYVDDAGQFPNGNGQILDPDNLEVVKEIGNSQEVAFGDNTIYVNTTDMIVSYSLSGEGASTSGNISRHMSAFTDLHIAGGKMYATSWPVGLLVVNIDEPLLLYEEGWYSIPGGLFDIEVNEDYIWGASAGMVRMQNGAPRANMEAIASAEQTACIEQYGDYVLVCLNEWVHILDKEMSRNFGGWYEASFPSDIAVDEAVEVAYVAAEDGLHVIDISDPNSPQRLHKIAGSFHAVELSEDHDTLFAIEDMEQGKRLHSIDVSDPNFPQQLDSIDGQFAQLDISGDRMYVVGGSYFFVVDVGNPANMQIIGNRQTDPSLSVVEVYDDDYVVVGGYGTIGLITVREDNIPRMWHWGGRTGLYTAFAVYGKHVYAANNTTGFELWQLEIPEPPPTPPVGPPILRHQIYLPYTERADLPPPTPHHVVPPTRGPLNTPGPVPRLTPTP